MDKNIASGGGGEDYDSSLIVSSNETEAKKRVKSTSETGTRSVMSTSMIAVTSAIISTPSAIVFFSPALFIFLNN